MPQLDLFIMSGQSNMQGQSEGPAAFAPPGDIGFEYKFIPDELVPVGHPSGEDIRGADGEMLLLGAHQGYGGLTPAFARAYHAACGRRACYVHCAKGATTIAQWLRGTARYDALLAKAKAAELRLARAGYAVGGRYFVWLQGESDGIEGTSKGAYRAMLDQFQADLAADLSIDAFMIIRIAMFYRFACRPIMAAQEEACAAGRGFVMLTRAAQSFTVENGLMQGESAPFHYTNAGYDLLGETAGRNAALHVVGRPFALEADGYL